MNMSFRSRNDKPLQGWSKAKERVDGIAPIAAWHVHDLRRTFATQMRGWASNAWW